MSGRTRQFTANAPNHLNVASSASVVPLLAANAARLGASIYNDSAQVLYVKLDDDASATSFWVKLASQGYVEVPFGYIGVVSGLWASADGSARVTEFF